MTEVTKKRLDTAIYPCYSINNNNRRDTEIMYTPQVYITKQRNGSYLVSAMVKDPYGTRVERQVYYGYTKDEARANYLLHLISSRLDLA